MTDTYNQIVKMLLSFVKGLMKNFWIDINIHNIFHFVFSLLLFLIGYCTVKDIFASPTEYLLLGTEKVTAPALIGGLIFVVLYLLFLITIRAVKKMLYRRKLRKMDEKESQRRKSAGPHSWMGN